MKKSKVLFIAINALWALPAFSTPVEDDANFFKERESEAYVQKGIRSGSFMYLPSFDLTNEYNSNIYMRDKRLGVTDSYVAHYKPGADIRSDWTRHSLSFGLNTDIAQYATQSNNNDYQDVMTHVDSKLDLTRNSYLNNNFAYNHVHENRGSPDQIGGMTPTIYDTKIIDNFYTQKFNRVAIKTGINTGRYDYEDVKSSLGTTLKMSTRDRWEYKPMIRLGYEIQPQYEVFAKFEYKQVVYDALVLSSGSGTAFNRSSNGYNATTGLDFNLTNLLTGDFSVGYVQRSYDDLRLTQVSGINGFLNLKYLPTKLTTVLARIGRDINESTQQGVSGSLNTTANLSAEHELYRNVLLKVGGNVGQTDYQGYDRSSSTNTFNRNDLLYGGTASAKYLLNRNLATDLTYTYSSRDSNYLNSNFIMNQIMLNLRGQF